MPRSSDSGHRTSGEAGQSGTPHEMAPTDHCDSFVQRRHCARIACVPAESNFFRGTVASGFLKLKLNEMPRKELTAQLFEAVR